MVVFGLGLSSFGGEAEQFWREASPLPPPVDRTLTVYIAELVMSQKMAAFVLASMGKVCWRVFADTA